MIKNFKPQKIPLTPISSEASGPELVAQATLVAAPTLLNPAVTVYGSKLCVCCTKLRHLLEVAGWRYRWHEFRPGKKNRRIPGFPEWKGTLPVVKVNGIFQELHTTDPNGEDMPFAPWEIQNPKKSVMLTI